MQSSVPSDVYALILRQLPIKELVKLRTTSKQIKAVIDRLLTDPKRILEIVMRLQQDDVYKFMQYYKTTASYHDLQARNPTYQDDPAGRICLQLATMGRSLDYFRAISTVPLDTDPATFKLLDSLSAPAIKTLLHSLQRKKSISNIKYDVESAFLSHSMESMSKDQCMSYFIISLEFTDIRFINTEVLRSVIEILKEKFAMKNDKDFMNYAQGLSLTLAAKKDNKTDEDWELIKRGAKCYINLSAADLSGVSLVGIKLPKANLSAVNFMSSDLSKAVITSAVLTSANFQDTTLTDTNLSGSDLSKVNMCQAKLISTNFSDCKMSNCDIGGATLENNNFSRVNFREIDFDHMRTENQEVKMKKPILTDTKWLTANMRDLDSFRKDLSSLNSLRAEPNFEEYKIAIANDLVQYLYDNIDLSINVLKYALDDSALFKKEKVKEEKAERGSRFFEKDTSPPKFSAREILQTELTRLEELKKTPAP